VPIAHAEVATERATRYLAQLCEHLNEISHHDPHGATTHALGPPRVRRVEWSDDHAVIEFTAGRCTLDAGEGRLSIVLVADDADELSRMQELFARRLETVGRRDRLTVVW
jgi:hypothetical protein